MPSAYIDLKNCQFYIESGLNKGGDAAGAVNLIAGYPIGTTTLVVDGITDTVATGQSIWFEGHGTPYTITAHTETSSATTGITISPALVKAVIDDEDFVLGGQLLEVTIGEGNITFDEKRALEYKKNRGKLDVVRLGDEEPLDVNFAFAWTYLSSISSETVPTVGEALSQTGNAADWVSTGLDCEPYAVNLIILNTPSNCGAASDPIEKIKLPAYRYTSLAHDPKAGTVTSQGTCNVTRAIYERLAANE